MTFNSAIFLQFFLVVYFLYLIAQRSKTLQNVILLAGSIVFYGYWDWRFLGLLGFSIGITYWASHRVAEHRHSRARIWIFAGAVVLNLAVLGFFKYFNFFADNIYAVFRLAGLKVDAVTLNLVLPVGISFYTFQAIGYLADVYREDIKPCADFMTFALFVSFFPQLVAGPIERARNLLPQLARSRTISAEKVNLGIYLILWGYFKKVVIADNMATISNPVFNDYTAYHGFDLALAAVAFAFQIYGDFAGYSDIARGLASLLGIRLMVNFRLPYMATNPQDFWRRWHISLSTWFRDYLYIPLGGSRHGRWATLRNLGITMLLCGLWHGAQWNFVLWGAYHWLLLVVFHAASKGSIPYRPFRLRWIMAVLMMFILNLAGWVLFRSSSLQQIHYIFTNMGLAWSPHTYMYVKKVLLFATPLIMLEIWQFARGNLAYPATLHPLGRAVLYGLLLSGIIALGVRESVEFIYFQF